MADTSVWVDHFRNGNPSLSANLEAGRILTHPSIIGELAVGNLSQRKSVLADLRDLPAAVIATDAEVLSLIERNRLFGLGLGYIDAHLLAATRLTRDAKVWTLDKRLHGVAERFGLAATGV